MEPQTPGRGGTRYATMVFTEQGVAMLSSALNSDRAVLVNILIIRVFTRMREMPSTDKDILLKLEQPEQKTASHNAAIKDIFDYLKELLTPSTDTKPIGFKYNA